ncbi:MAG: rod shape-determining protein MreC [Acholeplasmataceae bacterium]
MPRLNKSRKRLTIWVVATLAITLFFNIFRYNPLVNSIKEGGYDFFATIKYSLFDFPVTSILNFSKDLTGLWSLREENDLLRSQLAMLEQYQADSMFHKKRIAELEALLEFKSENTRLNLILGQVIFRSSKSWNNTLKINVGSKDGVQINQAVMIPGGLIGRVDSVSDNTATVSLLLTKDAVNKVSIKVIADGGDVIHGVLELFDYEKQVFVVNLLEANISVTLGSSVVTSGLGGVFPENLLVGKIEEKILAENDLVTRLYVKPAANFHDFTFLYVVSSED